MKILTSTVRNIGDSTFHSNTSLIQMGYSPKSRVHFLNLAASKECSFLLVSELLRSVSDSMRHFPTLAARCVDRLFLKLPSSLWNELFVEEFSPFMLSSAGPIFQYLYWSTNILADQYSNICIGPNISIFVLVQYRILVLVLYWKFSNIGY